MRGAGTIGGSVANNDPNADYPAAVLGLGATIVTNKRKIAADDYFKGMFETALEPDEIITEITFPIVKKAAYMKFQASGLGLRPGRGVRVEAVVRDTRGGDRRGRQRRIRVPQFEEALKKRFAPKSLEASRCRPTAIPTSTARRNIARIVGVMARRAVAAANERGGDEE